MSRPSREQQPKQAYPRHHLLLTSASATDPQPLGAIDSLASKVAVVGGFQYAFLASTILNGIGLLIALRIKRDKGPKGD